MGGRELSFTVPRGEEEGGEEEGYAQGLRAPRGKERKSFLFARKEGRSASLLASRTLFNLALF